MFKKTEIKYGEIVNYQALSRKKSAYYGCGENKDAKEKDLQ